MRTVPFDAKNKGHRDMLREDMKSARFDGYIIQRNYLSDILDLADERDKLELKMTKLQESVPEDVKNLVLGYSLMCIAYGQNPSRSVDNVQSWEDELLALIGSLISKDK